MIILKIFVLILTIGYLLKYEFNEHKNGQICLWQKNSELLFTLFGYLIPIIVFFNLLILKSYNFVAFTQSQILYLVGMSAILVTLQIIFNSYEINQTNSAFIKVAITRIITGLCSSILFVFTILLICFYQDEKAGANHE